MDWIEVKLKNAISQPIKNGYSPLCPREENGKWILSLGALTDENLDITQKKPAPADDPKVDEHLLRKNDFLVSRSNTLDKVGRCALFKGEISNCSFPDLMMRFRVDETIINPGFLENYLKSSKCRKYFQRLASGTSRSMVKINKAALENLKISLPPLSEQKKIARILSTWDLAIEKLETLIGAKQKRKKALMQQLLTGKKQIKEFKNEQPKFVKIGDLISESRLPGSNGLVAKKLSVKLHGKGVCQKIEKRQGSENTKYYIRKSGQFIYSKLDFLNGAFGIIPENLDGFESTLDLPCFDFKGGVDPDFFLYFVKRDEFYLRFLGSALGGRKARRISPSELLSTKIRLPGLEEQAKIKEVLTNADREIELHQKQLNAFKHQKKGLMQQLLTGKKRVQPDPEDL